MRSRGSSSRRPGNESVFDARRVAVTDEMRIVFSGGQIFCYKRVGSHAVQPGNTRKQMCDALRMIASQLRMVV